MILKFLKFLKISKRYVKSMEKFSGFISIDESTILLGDTDVRFDAISNLENRKYVTIGKNGLIRAEFIFESSKGEIVIGNNVQLGGAILISRNRIEIKDDVTMAWGITIYDHNSHSILWEERKNDNIQCYNDYIKFHGDSLVNKDWSCVANKPIIIESKVWVGFDVLILKGVTIGEGAVIGAKSVITKDVEAWTVVAGNPAVVVKYLPEYIKSTEI